MAVKFSNNAKTTLSSGITSSATSIAVVDAAAWPTLGSGDHTLCTLITVADPDVLEIVKVTAISGNTLTVVRAQEGTTARAFASADKAELRVTAGLLEQALTGTDVVKLDSLTASATASYSMAVGGVAYSPSNVNALVVSLNGVTQEPTDAFTISGSTLTFASALTSADSIDYIVDLAKTLDIGEPSDNTVSPAKLTSAVNLDAITDNGATTTNAVTVGSLTSTGIDDNATSTAITIDANENVGIGVTDPDATLEVHMPDSATGPYFHGGGSRGLRIADSTITNAGDRTEFYKPTSSGMFSFKNSLKELLTIKSSGRIGSDETNPQDRIHIKGSLPALRLENTAGAADSYTRIAGIDGALRIQADQGNSTANSFIAFDVDTVERMRVDSSGSVNITGSVISDAVRTDGTSFSSNVDSAYLIAGTSGWTGATTNWDTYGFQHKIKTDGSGVVRLTIDTHLGEKFSIKNNGNATFSGNNVGINTATFSSTHDKLVVKGSSAYGRGIVVESDNSAANWARMDLRNVNAGHNFILYQDQAGNASVRNDSSNGSKTMSFLAGNSVAGSFVFQNTTSPANQVMKIDETGGLRVGHNTNIFNGSAQERFTVKNTVRGCAATFEATDVSGGFPILYIRSSDTTANQNCVLFYRGGTNIGGITTSASSTSYNTSSDYRLKENIVNLDNAVDRLKQIPVYQFNFTADANVTVDGFIAHEVSEVVPEAVSGEKDGMRNEEYEITPAVLDDMGNTIEDAVMGTREVPQYQGIDQSKLVPLLTKAIQEQQAIIEDLQTRLSALEAN
jgi:hypothetical protein